MDISPESHSVTHGLCLSKDQKMFHASLGGLETSQLSVSMRSCPVTPTVGAELPLLKDSE